MPVMLSMSRKGLTLALASGVLASVAGIFGKLAMTESETLWICESIASTFDLTIQDGILICNHGIVYLRLVCFVMMILTNALMWTTFVKALRFSNTSLEATVSNTGANFFASGMFGRLLFDENVSLMWWLGTLLICFGLTLINYTEKGGKISPSALFSSNKTKHKRH